MWLTSLAEEVLEILPADSVRELTTVSMIAALLQGLTNVGDVDLTASASHHTRATTTAHGIEAAVETTTHGASLESATHAAAAALATAAEARLCLTVL